MSESIAHEKWATWTARLQEPFDPEEVDYRVQRGTMVVAYVDARTVAKHLDEAVGAENWSFDWSVVSLSAKNEVALAKGMLTIGGITKCDVGEDSNYSPSKGAVSDALKRAAVLFGVGRYLYDLPVESVQVDKDKPTPAALKKLRASLPRPKGYTEQSPRLPDPGGPEPTPIRKHTVALPLQVAAEPSIVPVEPSKKDWDRLKIRVNNNGMITNKEEWHKFEEETGANYEEMLAKVEAYEAYEAAQADLHTVPALDGTKGLN